MPPVSSAASSSTGSVGSSGILASGSESRSSATWRASDSNTGTRGASDCNASTVRRIASAVAASAATPCTVGSACAASRRLM